MSSENLKSLIKNLSSSSARTRGEGALLTPLASDYYQRRAIEKSRSGASFVLYGPPGTGKSQTIASIIANAVHDGKRVLLVAKKQSALKVIKGRLDEIGIGGFCLEFYGDGNPSCERLAERVECALSLEKAPSDGLFEGGAKQLKELYGTLSENTDALHRVRPFGMSLYEGVCVFLASSGADGLLSVDNSFFDCTTLADLDGLKDCFVLACSAACECAKLQGSPFDGVGLDFCDGEIVRSAVVAAHRLKAEAARLKSVEKLCAKRERVRAEYAFNRALKNFKKTLRYTPEKAIGADICAFYSKKCTAIIKNIAALPVRCAYVKNAEKLRSVGIELNYPAIIRSRPDREGAAASFYREVYKSFVSYTLTAEPELANYYSAEADHTARAFLSATQNFINLSREKIKNQLILRLPAEGSASAFKDELSYLRRNLFGIRGGDVNSLLAGIPNLIRLCAPCIIATSEALASHSPLCDCKYDEVIFDEASQLTLQESLLPVSAARAIIIAGDYRQLPPTSFFKSGEGEDSLLDTCLSVGMDEVGLVWHYRSRHESLIRFSNQSYYQSKLCTYPSPREDDFSVSFNFVEGGVYGRGTNKCNKAEAEAVVSEIIRRLKSQELSQKSMGVVTFSSPQQALVERLIARAIRENNLEEQVNFCREPLFVKNLENVQGDERDVILFSVCYGPDADGKISLNFGPLNQFGGWRRLNVATSRAREEMLVFSSMHYYQVAAERTRSKGVEGLYNFLKFAEKGEKSPLDTPYFGGNAQKGVGWHIAEELKRFGYKCRCNMGASGFKVDVAVTDPTDADGYILAILTDGNPRFDACDVYFTQQTALERCGWNIARVYAVNYFLNPQREVAKLIKILDGLILAKVGKKGRLVREYRATNAKITLKEQKLSKRRQTAEAIKNAK